MIEPPKLTIPLNITLVPLTTLHAAAFCDLVDDDEVRQFFMELNVSREEIIARLPDENAADGLRQQWLVLADGVVAGYITLKKSTQIYDALHPAPEMDVEDPRFLDALDRTDEEQEKIELEEHERKMGLAPYAVDVIVHRDQRGRKIANRALQQVVALAKEMGLTEVYLETHQENKASIAWAAQLGACRLKTINAFYYPRHIYRYDFYRALKVRSVTWELIGFIPELAAERQLLNDLFDGFYHLPMLVEWWKDKDTCKFGQTLDLANKQFRLGIGVMKRTEPLSIIWSLAHEYGHALQPEPTEAEQVDGSWEMYAREQQAWDFAADWLAGYPYYIDHRECFESYSVSSLISYLPKD